MATRKSKISTTNPKRSFVEVVRANVVKTGVIGFGTFIAAIISGVVVVDDRYAHAGEVSKQITTINEGLEINRLTGEVAVLRIRKSNLEDKVFESNTRSMGRNLARADEMIQNRYRSELDEVNKQILDKEKLIDRIKTRTLQNQQR